MIVFRFLDLDLLSDILHNRLPVESVVFQVSRKIQKRVDHSEHDLPLDDQTGGSL